VMPLTFTSEAPGRICLFGDHQDYLLNPVIACSIDRKIKITCVENARGKFHIIKPDITGNNEEVEVIEFRDKIPAPKREQVGLADDLNFLVLALDVLSRYNCFPNKGYDVNITGTIPINAGLSSSSALTVAWIHFLVTAFGGTFDIKAKGGDDGDDVEFITIQPFSRMPLDKSLLARLAWETEVLELQTSGGKMDHYSISLGQCIYLNTNDNTYEQLQLILPSSSSSSSSSSSPSLSMPGSLKMVIGVSGQLKDTNGTLSHLKTYQLKAIEHLMNYRRRIHNNKGNNDLDENYSNGEFDTQIDYENIKNSILQSKSYIEAHEAILPYMGMIQKERDHNVRDRDKDKDEDEDEDLRPYLHAALINHYITIASYRLIRKYISEMNQASSSSSRSTNNPNQQTHAHAQATSTLRQIGKMMTAHNNSLRYDLKNTTELIDKMVDNAIDIPGNSGSGSINSAYGAKIIGSGGGGCIVALTSEESCNAVKNAIIEAGAVDAFVVDNISNGPCITMSRVSATVAATTMKTSPFPSPSPSLSLSLSLSEAESASIRKKRQLGEMTMTGSDDDDGDYKKNDTKTGMLDIDMEVDNIKSEEKDGEGPVPVPVQVQIPAAAYAHHDTFHSLSGGGIEPTADDSNKHIFKNFMEACQHYEFPGSHQVGSFGNKQGILRTYSNSTPGKDKILKDGHEIHYRLKDEKTKAKFQLNIDSKQCIRFFRKVQINKGSKPGCKDMGLFNVHSFIVDGWDAFVRLVQHEES